MPSRLRLLAAAAAALAAAAVLVPAAAVLPGAPAAVAAPQRAAGPKWWSAWTASPMGVRGIEGAPQDLEDRTVRNVVFLRAGGDQLRIRLSNHFGDRPVPVGAVSVAVAGPDGSVVESTRRTVTFGGSTGVSLPLRYTTTSDPIALSVPPATRLAVSIHLPRATGVPTWHRRALATSYTGSGDRTAQVDGTGLRPTSSWFFLSGVEVVNTGLRGTVVTLGDSITDGVGSRTDENTRYPDFLARRLHLLDFGRRMTVSNAGIAGAMLADRPDTANIEGAMQRFGRDVLGTEGVRGLVVLLGTNDLGQSAVSARSFTSQLCAVVQRARRQGIHVVLGTIPPGGSATYDDPRRGAINEWIRRSVDARIADGVADFDAVLRVSETDSRIRTPYLAYGDEYGVHPNSDGYEAMAAAVPLAVLNEDRAPFEVTCS
jgi:lysophospholipase L1-like esterase